MDSDAQHAAGEMIRIYGGEAESVASELVQKYARRGDAVGLRTWDDIRLAICERIQLQSGG